MGTLDESGKFTGIISMFLYDVGINLKTQVQSSFKM